MLGSENAIVKGELDQMIVAQSNAGTSLSSHSGWIHTVKCSGKLLLSTESDFSVLWCALEYPYVQTILDHPSLLTALNLRGITAQADIQIFGWHRPWLATPCSPCNENFWLFNDSDQK